MKQIQELDPSLSFSPSHFMSLHVFYSDVTTHVLSPHIIIKLMINRIPANGRQGSCLLPLSLLFSGKEIATFDTTKEKIEGEGVFRPSSPPPMSCQRCRPWQVAGGFILSQGSSDRWVRMAGAPPGVSTPIDDLLGVNICRNMIVWNSSLFFSYFCKLHVRWESAI